MSKNYENDYNENDELFDNDSEYFEDDYEEILVDHEDLDEPEKASWKDRFMNRDNNAQPYSRTSRNQPKQEASKLSRIILAAFVLLFIIPFLVLLLVDARRNNNDVPSRTVDQVMISKSSTPEESESKSESHSSQAHSENQLIVRDESVGSQTIAPTATAPNTSTPTQPATPTPPAQPTPPANTGSSHTVNAGETWYGIARQYGIDVGSLLAANGASEGTVLHPGDVVVIP